MSNPVREAHFSDATFFGELVKDREIVLARQRGVLLSSWEDPKE